MHLRARNIAVIIIIKIKRDNDRNFKILFYTSFFEGTSEASKAFRIRTKDQPCTKMK